MWKNTGNSKIDNLKPLKKLFSFLKKSCEVTWQITNFYIRVCSIENVCSTYIFTYSIFEVWSMLHHVSVSTTTKNATLCLHILFKLFFLSKDFCYYFNFLFWWSIKFPQQTELVIRNFQWNCMLVFHKTYGHQSFKGRGLR